MCLHLTQTLQNITYYRHVRGIQDDCLDDHTFQIN